MSWPSTAAARPSSGDSLHSTRSRMHPKVRTAESSDVEARRSFVLKPSPASGSIRRGLSRPMMRDRSHRGLDWYEAAARGRRRGIEACTAVRRRRDPACHGSGLECGVYKQAIRDKLIEHQQHIERYGDDVPEVRDWMWSDV